MPKIIYTQYCRHVKIRVCNSIVPYPERQWKSILNPHHPHAPPCQTSLYSTEYCGEIISMFDSNHNHPVLILYFDGSNYYISSLPWLHCLILKRNHQPTRTTKAILFRNWKHFNSECVSSLLITIKPTATPAVCIYLFLQVDNLVCQSMHRSTQSASNRYSATCREVFFHRVKSAMKLRLPSTTMRQ